MTDEEKAEEYVRNKADEGNFDLFGKAYFSESSMKQAFLAGLKTGRETEKEYVKNNAFTSMKEQGLFPFGKWHKVADVDLPKGEKYGKNGIHRKIYLKDHYGNLYTGRYYPKDKNHTSDCFAVKFLAWGFQYSQFCEKNQIVEWCEIEC